MKSVVNWFSLIVAAVISVIALPIGIYATWGAIELLLNDPGLPVRFLSDPTTAGAIALGSLQPLLLLGCIRFSTMEQLKEAHKDLLTVARRGGCLREQWPLRARIYLAKTSARILTFSFVAFCCLSMMVCRLASEHPVVYYGGFS